MNIYKPNDLDLLSKIRLNTYYKPENFNADKLIILKYYNYEDYLDHINQKDYSLLKLDLQKLYELKNNFVKETKNLSSDSINSSSDSLNSSSDSLSLFLPTHDYINFKNVNNYIEIMEKLDHDLFFNKIDMAFRKNINFFKIKEYNIIDLSQLLNTYKSSISIIDVNIINDNELLLYIDHVNLNNLHEKIKLKIYILNYIIKHDLLKKYILPVIN